MSRKQQTSAVKKTDDAAPRRKRFTFDEARDSQSLEDERAEVASIADRWRSLSPGKRRTAIKKVCADLFQRRFGVAWNDDWSYMVRLNPALRAYAKKAMIGKGRKLDARSPSDRSLMIVLWDLRLPFLPPQPVARQRSSLFLSPTELTWISLLGGNSPRVGRRALPQTILAAEREAIKKALQRFGVSRDEVFLDESNNVLTRKQKPARGPRKKE